MKPTSVTINTGRAPKLHAVVLAILNDDIRALNIISHH